MSCKLGIALSMFAVACSRSSPPAPSVSASANVVTRAASPETRVAAIREAEDERDPAAIGERDLSSPDVAVRRAAARALARIATDDARPGLLRLLADDDAEVVAFAAYGLGYNCADHEKETTLALVARAPSLPNADGKIDASFAIARAIGKCGGADAEATLVAWLAAGGVRAAHAALGLGDLALKQPLRDETIVALATAAAGSTSSPPLPIALVPFTRVDVPVGASATRVREVATALLTRPGEGRIFAIRALGRTGPEGATELAKVLVPAAGFDAAERAEAVRSLARLREKGSDALGEVLGDLVPAHDKVSLSALVGDGYGPLAAAVETVRAPFGKSARTALESIASLPVPDDAAPPSLVRRIVHLRCAAARALASGSIDSRDLATCDPKNGEEASLAKIATLGEGSIDTKKKREAVRALAASPSARVRSAAFDLLVEHPEDPDAADLARDAIGAAREGTLASAAQLVAARGAEWRDDAAKKAMLSGPILAALDRPWKGDEVETVASLVTAAGALHVEGAKEKLRSYCASPSPTLRAAAAKALQWLGEREVKCPPKKRDAAAPELGHLVRRARVVLDTEAGELAIDLEPDLAPVATTRFVDLVKEGFYDGMAVHRVVPGFVVQFGDKIGDGTGGAGRDALRCETSPVPFVPLSVGVALAGRDTGSCQFFVTLSRTPHLDGEHARIGTATGDWAAVAEGDRIRKARVVE